MTVAAWNRAIMQHVGGRMGGCVVVGEWCMGGWIGGEVERWGSLVRWESVEEDGGERSVRSEWMKNRCVAVQARCEWMGKWVHYRMVLGVGKVIIAEEGYLRERWQVVRRVQDV